MFRAVPLRASTIIERPARRKGASAPIRQYQDAQASRASSDTLIEPSARDTGHSALAFSASSLNLAASIPGTLPTTVSALPVMPVPGTSVTTALASRLAAGVPFSARKCENCMAKQPACAAPSSSSGLVPDLPLSSSKRALKEYGRFDSAPLCVVSVPLPSLRLPFQIAVALRSMVISLSVVDGRRTAARL